MNNYDDMNQKSNMIIYTTEDGLTKLKRIFYEEYVRVFFEQKAEVVQRKKSYFSKHKKKLFKTSEGERQLLQILQQLRQMEKPIRLTTIILMLSFLSAIV